MESQGSLVRYVLRSLMGRWHQAGETGPSQAPRSPSQTSNTHCRSTSGTACCAPNHRGFASERFTRFCPRLGGSACNQIELICSVCNSELRENYSGRAEAQWPFLSFVKCETVRMERTQQSCVLRFTSYVLWGQGQPVCCVSDRIPCRPQCQ
jgi:hypothetical protein